MKEEGKLCTIMGFYFSLLFQGVKKKHHPKDLKWSLPVPIYVSWMNTLGKILLVLFLSSA